MPRIPGQHDFGDNKRGGRGGGRQRGCQHINHVKRQDNIESVDVNLGKPRNGR